jgi:hypothetical protein
MRLLGGNRPVEAGRMDRWAAGRDRSREQGGEDDHQYGERYPSSSFHSTSSPSGD